MATGAELSEVEQLSQKYTTTGAELQDKAQALVTRIHAAVEKFESTMNDLASQTTTLTGEITSSMTELHNHANGVDWKGENRTRFDADISTYRGAITGGSTAITEDVTSIKSEIASKFHPFLESFGRKVSTHIDTAKEATSVTAESVAQFRDTLDRAGNAGWTT